MAPCVVALTAFTLYWSTLAPGIVWANHGADGGDLLTAAFTWGIPHPTGYPTYLILLRLFSWVIPIGTPAFRGNLMSAAAGATAGALVYVAARRLAGTVSAGARTPGWMPPIAGIVAAIGAAAGRELWSQATITEVYTLNACLTALVLAGCVMLLTGASAERRETWLIAGIALTIGLGLGNHLTLALAAGPVFAVALLLRLRCRGWRRRIPLLAAATLPLVVGLGVYVYSPIASRALPPVNWGHPDSPRGFWWMISGSIYQDYAFGVAARLLISRVATTVDLFLAQFTIVGVWLGFAGIYALWNRHRPLAVSTAVGVIMVSAYAICYDTPDSFLYLIPAFMVFAIWSAAGLAWVVVESRRTFGRRWSEKSTGLATAGLIGVAFLAIPCFSVLRNAPALDLRNDREASVFAAGAVSAAQPDGIVLAADSERVFSLWYQTYVQDPQTGVAVVSLPHLQFDWYWEDLHRQFPGRIPDAPPAEFKARIDAIVEFNVGARPVVAASAAPWLSGYSLTAVGPVFRIDALE